MLGSVVGVYGSKQQVEIYGKYVSKILEWEKGQAGLVALISVPEVIVAEILTLMGMVALASNNLEPFTTILHSKIIIDYNNPPQSFFTIEGVFYCDGLGGNSTTVHDHMRELFKSYDWLVNLVPELEDKTDDFEIQTNFLRVILSVLNKGRLWADFARFYASRIMPLVHKIKYDLPFQSQLSILLGVEKEEVRKTVNQVFEKIESDWTGGGRFWWQSIDLEDLYTKEELEEKEKQSKQV